MVDSHSSNTPSPSRHPLRPSFERDLGDLLVFLKEVLLVTWRFNPAGVAAYSCQQLFETISEATPQPQKGAMIAELLGSIEVFPVETFEAEFASGIAQICQDGISSTIASAVEQYPHIETCLRQAIGDETQSRVAVFRRMTLNALQKQRPQYAQLHAHYGQLCEFLPRYVGIMNRTRVWDGILGFTAGLMGGYLGAAGAELWENWRNANDQEFCQKFSSALEQFMRASSDYTVRGEAALSVVFDRLIDEVSRLQHLLFDAYDQLAAEGLDIEPLYHRYRSLPGPLDPQTHQLFQIALSNLEVNRTIHFRTIENIHSIIRLDAQPAISAADLTEVPDVVAPQAELPEPSAEAEPLLTAEAVVPEQAEAPVVPEIAETSAVAPVTAPLGGELTLAMIQSVLEGFTCEGLFWGEAIPPKKIDGARGSYAPQVLPEQVLLLQDTSLFGNGKVGLILTPTGIHWRNGFEAAQCVMLDALRSVSVIETSSIFRFARLMINDLPMEVSGGTSSRQNQLAQLLYRLIQPFQKAA